MNRSFSWIQSIYVKIPLLFVVILVIVFQFVSIYFIDQLETQSVTAMKEQINTQIDFLTNNVVPILEDQQLTTENRNQRLEQALDSFSSTYATKIQIVNSQDYLLATNDLAERSSIGTRTNDELVRNVLINQRPLEDDYFIRFQQPYHVVKPILSTKGDRTIMLGAIAVRTEMDRMNEQREKVTDLFLRAILIAILAGFILAFVLSQGITTPIENMRQQALRISEGIYDFPAEVFGHDEIGDLAVTINDLAVKVRDAQESTESEKQRLDGVLRHMTDGVIGTDRRGNILLVNDRALLLLGMYQNEAVGQPILEILGIDENYTLAKFLKGDHEVLVNKFNDGIKTVLKCEFSVIRRETGFVTGLVCVIQDVTEQEKNEQERRDFVSNVSHELRTPLTSIKSYSEALIDGAWKDQTIAPEFLEVIQSESNRMIRMIGNLLDLSKLDGGQVKPNFEYVDFKRLVNYILDRAEFTLESEDKPKYKIIRQLTRKEIYVEIDQDRITQVIDNLMNNAMKYSPDGSEIVVTLADYRDHVVFSVQDSGLGIPQKDLPYLFDRFYRVDKARSRQQGGTGLGLAISKEVIELHGGKIWVKSEENKGSTFLFSLPYTELEFEDDWEET
ncbi:ATP-binding protein [Facklamia miroungae]|uniref:histidine kinase n=1 Tax=Facklamia miroungae TaxID=120956 RepID=A0A1G7S3L7_9LACT|nr:ATP-binding protein [Facklamia miroungae]NKZ29191.1 cell wall metabolism sensor histidine kinase WalK [Facklamia miroungae]SDG17039.1 two-component system, OmpR family, sensor histidine kinase VicK [Facklamia miroungae]